MENVYEKVIGIIVFPFLFTAYLLSIILLSPVIVYTWINFKKSKEPYHFIKFIDFLDAVSDLYK